MSADAQPVDASFDYLYVDANEGSSSGGHTAIRFGARVYHFQNRGGLLVLDRERADDFLHDYALLANRTIHVSRVAVDAPTAEQLRSNFNRRHHAQEAQLDVFAALGEDRALFALWERRREAAFGERPIPAAGYFLPADDAAAPNPQILALRQRIERRHGPAHLHKRKAELQALLQGLAQGRGAAWHARPPEGRYDQPRPAYPFSRRWDDTRAGLAALRVLATAAPLRVFSMVRPSTIAPLSSAEIDRVRSRIKLQEEEILRLSASSRPDWGRALLVALARRIALERSLETGHWMVLDTFPADAAKIDAARLVDRREIMDEMLNVSRGHLERARSQWARAIAPSERDYAKIEDLANRVHELERAVSAGAPLRLHRKQMSPGLAGKLELDVPITLAVEGLLERARKRESAFRSRLVQLYGYDLFTHNCVTEIFATILEATGESPTESARRLGGFVDGRRSLHFVPFIAAGAVNADYRVTRRGLIPSWRDRQLRAMEQQEPAFWVALRESNTLTARSYDRGLHDSFFLFFTDSERPAAVGLRPLFGVANLIGAIGESLLGLAKLPADRGRTLKSGLLGAFVSLPELAFSNIRKGSNDWVPPHAIGEWDDELDPNGARPAQ